MVALGGVGNPHIQKEISILNPRTIWLHHLWGTLLWPQGISTEMGIRHLEESEMCLAECWWDRDRGELSARRKGE